MRFHSVVAPRRRRWRGCVWTTGRCRLVAALLAMTSGVAVYLALLLSSTEPFLLPLESTNGYTRPESFRQGINGHKRFRAADSRLSSSSPLNKLLYTGYFGMGHRLSKLSAAVHLAKSLDLPLVQVDWGTCSGNVTAAAKAGSESNQIKKSEVDIFAHLFGSNQIHLRDPRTDGSDDQHKVVWVRNDVAGYAAAQSYKNMVKLALPYEKAVELFTNKLEADHTLWTELFQQRFTGQGQVEDFQTATKWRRPRDAPSQSTTDSASFVIGVHVRAGNGEQDHFVAANRGFQKPMAQKTSTRVNNESDHAEMLALESMKAAVRPMARLIRQLIRATQEVSETLQSPSIFVATDTVQYVDLLRVALDPYPVVSFEAQPRVAFGQGVSYQAWSSSSTTKSDENQCLAGWTSAAVDMALLADTDVLIATTRSTFTQIVPASFVLHRLEATKRVPWRFCEMDLQVGEAEVDVSTQNDKGNGLHGTSRMTCFASQHAWLFRRPVDDFRTFCTTDGVNNEEATTASASCSAITPAVAHKAMVHLPEVDNLGSTASASRPKHTKLFEAARDFLQAPLLSQNESMFYYGRKFDPKYRQTLPFQSDWTWRADE